MRLLFCPLDWGLGHASRLIPLVHEFHNNGYDIMIGGSGKSAELMKTAFKDLPFVKINSIPVSYYFYGKWFVLNILIHLPALIYNMIKEYLVLKKLIRLHSLSIVISDNRYGLHNSHIRSIIITHQVSPVLPRFMQFAEYPVHKFLKILINRFDECWIPDFKGQNNLTGNLAHRFNLPLNAKFIGPLSRFQLKNISGTSAKFNYVIILSGPQPQLGKITRKILAKTSEIKEKTIFICGFQDISGFVIKNPYITVVSHLESEIFRSVLENADLIVSTAGYSGIMDLYTLGRPAILIPVKGQTEQEYLCSYLQKEELFLSLDVDDIDFGNSASYMERLGNYRSRMANFKDKNLPLNES